MRGQGAKFILERMKFSGAAEKVHENKVQFLVSVETKREEQKTKKCERKDGFVEEFIYFCSFIHSLFHSSTHNERTGE